MNTDSQWYNLSASSVPFFLFLISASPAGLPLGAKVAKEQQRTRWEGFSAGNQSCMQVAQLLSFTSTPLKQCRECAHNWRGSCWMQPALTATFFQIGAPVCCLIDLWHNVQQYWALHLRAKNEETGRDEQHSCFSCCTKWNYTGSKSPSEKTRHKRSYLSQLN